MRSHRQKNHSGSLYCDRSQDSCSPIGMTASGKLISKDRTPVVVHLHTENHGHLESRFCRGGDHDVTIRKSAIARQSRTTS